MKWWNRLVGIFTPAKPEFQEHPQWPDDPPHVIVQRRRRMRKELRRPRKVASFERSQTEANIIAALQLRQPMTVKMVAELVDDTTTVSQALTQMWKRGTVCRRREEGRNAYWYALTPDAFASFPQTREVVMTEFERRKRDSEYDRILREAGKDDVSH